MKKLVFASVAAALLTAASSRSEASTLIGSQVTATVYYPNLSTPDSYPDTQTVGPGIEFPSGSILGLTGSDIIGVNIDVGADTVTFTYTQNAQSASGAFNGYVLDFNPSSAVILGVSIDPSSTYQGVPLSFGPHQITENQSGLYVTTGSTILLDVDLAPSANVAPEPQAWALVLGGLGLIALSPWRKAASKQASI